MAFRPTLPLCVGMGLPQPRTALPKLFLRRLPVATYPYYHPLRAEFPTPAVHHVSKPLRKAHLLDPLQGVPRSHGPPTHFRIQLKRSPLSLPEVYKETLVHLGLTKKDRIVFHPHGDNIAGKILRVKELVEVRNVSWWMMEDEMKRGKGQGRGLERVKGENRWNEERNMARRGWVGDEQAFAL